VTAAAAMDIEREEAWIRVVVFAKISRASINEYSIEDIRAIDPLNGVTYSLAPDEEDRACMALIESHEQGVFERAAES
jgi:hypothetical protein